MQNIYLKRLLNFFLKTRNVLINNNAVKYHNVIFAYVEWISRIALVVLFHPSNASSAWFPVSTAASAPSTPNNKNKWAVFEKNPFLNMAPKSSSRRYTRRKAIGK